jgi:hypothetical protein
MVSEMNASLAETVDEVTGAISKAIPVALGDIAGVVGEHLSEQSLEHASQLEKAYLERTEAVQRMWGEVLDRLDFLRHIVLEWNSAASQHREGAYSRPNTSFALDRLVARAYETVGEVITLARGGYADGALARWRSLHEVCVIAMFLGRQSDACALMYLEHHKVEELRLLRIDSSRGTAMAIDEGYGQYRRDLLGQTAALVTKFGKAFASDYGWASIELGRPKTTFRDLENHVGLETLRRGYQRANSAVHGGALATLSRVSLGPGVIDGAWIPPAHGCEVALNHATASLSMMVAELCLDIADADVISLSMVVHDCMRRIREQIDSTCAKISGDSLRDRILQRKAAQRKLRTKQERIVRRRH